jgi:alkylation response protein AidB-like acyl-CoA dehydrogenase
VPIGVTAEQAAMADSISRWAKRAGSIAVVRGLEARAGQTGWPTTQWSGLAELGVFAVAVPERFGGVGGSIADVAVVVEQLAGALVPGPVAPTLLTALVLASAIHGGELDYTVAADLLAAIAAGTASVGVAMSACLTGTREADGGLVVGGTADLVVGAGDCSHLLLGAVTDEGESWFVVQADAPGVCVARRCPVDFSRALGDVVVTDLPIRSAQLLAGLRRDVVMNLAATLAAAEASGVASWCVRVASDHALVRRQFGRPIGSFQAIKHLCASMLCRTELAAAAAADAAMAADRAPDELPLAAAAAAAVALDAAVDNAKDCVQVLGGIGFTWEHDAHLYLRRALALRQLLGGTVRWRERAAELALGGARRHSFEIDELEPAAAPGKEQPPEEQAPGVGQVREAARAAAKAVAALPPQRQRVALAQAGYAAPGWPAPYGRSASSAAQIVIDTELARAGLTRPDLGIGDWAIPAIARHGSPAQLERFAGPTLRGEISWCQLFSEPEAGSDLASLRTRAVRTEGGWLLTGQKVWTSLANEADWAICLARSDPDAPKHRGITYFLVSMRAAGIEIRPLREITGRSMFNEVFLGDVFVPDDCVVGQPGGGWPIARTTLATERVAMARGARLTEDVEELLAAAKAHIEGVSDPTVIEQIGARLAEGLALSVMDERLARATASGVETGMASAVRKLLGVAHRQSVAETALSMCGVEGAATDGAAARLVHEFLLTRCLSIAGGTTQILLSMVAERMLGLPRDDLRERAEGEPSASEPKGRGAALD